MSDRPQARRGSELARSLMSDAIPHTLHVWNIYLHWGGFWGVNVGIYGIHGVYGLYCTRTPGPGASIDPPWRKFGVSTSPTVGPGIGVFFFPCLGQSILETGGFQSETGHVLRQAMVRFGTRLPIPEDTRSVEHRNGSAGGADGKRILRPPATKSPLRSRESGLRCHFKSGLSGGHL